MGTIEEYLNSSISVATLRAEDLIPAFEACLRDILGDAANGIMEEDWEALEEEERSWYLNETLFDALNDLCPSGYYFGSTEGDGADFGFWEGIGEDGKTLSERKADIIKKVGSLDSEGNLPAYAWPGGYPIYYYTKGGSMLCPDCATKELNDPDAWDPIIDGDVYWEGPPMQCDGNCGKLLESAYGEPEDD